MSWSHVEESLCYLMALGASGSKAEDISAKGTCALHLRLSLERCGFDLLKQQMKRAESRLRALPVHFSSSEASAFTLRLKVFHFSRKDHPLDV